MLTKNKITSKEQSALITWHLREVGVAIHQDEICTDPRFYRIQVYPGYYADSVPYNVDFETMERISIHEAHYSNHARWQKSILNGLENGKYTYSAGWNVWDMEHRTNPTTEIRRWIDQNIHWMLGNNIDLVRIEEGKRLAPAIRHAISYIIQYGESAYVRDFEGVTAADVLRSIEGAQALEGGAE